MKKILIIAVILNSVLSFGQNLKPDASEKFYFNVWPTDMRYFELKNIFVKPLSNTDFVYKSNLEGSLNNNYYTLVDAQEKSDIYLAFKTVTYVATPLRTTSKTEQRTQKDGTKYNVTTYTSDMTYKYWIEISMYLVSGEKITSSVKENSTTYSESSENRDASINAVNKLASNGNTAEIKSLIYNTSLAIQDQYLVANKSVVPFSFGIKSKKEDYTDFNEASEMFNKWFKSKNYDPNSEDLKNAMTIIDNALTELDTENKKARIDSEVGALCYYYKAYVAFLQGNLALANENIMKSEELDKKLHYTQQDLVNNLTKMQTRGMF